MSRLQSITATLEMLNDRCGRGDVLGVVLDADYRGGAVVRKRTSCEPETRRFRYCLETRTVFFERHQMKLHS